MKATRLHPFNVAFGTVADEWFGAIRAAADRINATDLAQFSRLAPVEQLLREMEPGDAGPETAERADEYVRLLYAGYHFWDTGRSDRDVRREVLVAESTRTAPGTRPLPLAGAVYCRFPERWFWGQVADGLPHEPLDGLFVVPGGRGKREWIVVAVLGLRADRGGFSQISVTASANDMAAATSLRDPPFAPVMSGGDLAGFCSITSVAELLLLARLALLSAGQ